VVVSVIVGCFHGVAKRPNESKLSHGGGES
jgi:hypothetical protein